MDAFEFFKNYFLSLTALVASVAFAISAIMRGVPADQLNYAFALQSIFTAILAIDALDFRKR